MKFGFSLFLLAVIMYEESTAYKLRLEHWMRDLPPQLKEMPLMYLAIPGSHDSMTYGITRSSTVAPDAEPILHQLYPLFRGTILRWTITQASDTWQQLLIGIRYLDLRLATKPNDDKFYFTHGLYGQEISPALDQVKKFIETHREEVVILDFQHFYGFSPDDHVRLMKYLQNLYGPRLVWRSVKLLDASLEFLTRVNRRIIVVYRNSTAHEWPEFWQPNMLPSPWPQKDTIAGLTTFFKNLRRPLETGFVHQAVLTPTPTFIVLRWISSLREKCAVPVLNEMLPRISEFSPGRPPMGNKTATVNVVIADFVDMNNAKFPRSIIDLNMKLIGHIVLMNHHNG